MREVWIFCGKFDENHREAVHELRRVGVLVRTTKAPENYTGVLPYIESASGEKYSGLPGISEYCQQVRSKKS